MKDMNTKISSAPLIHVIFDSHLLSKPTWGFKSKYLLKISEFLQKKIHSGKFKKNFGATKKLKKKHHEFMEIYERVKVEEGKDKGKKYMQTECFGYTPRFTNRNDQRAFEKLNNRAQISEFDRKKYSI